jgi:predicted ester cyclase
MKLTQEEMERRLDEHFGFEARDDVEGVLSTLHPDVDHDVVGWPAGPSRGRDQARDFYQATFADLADGKVRSLRRLYGDNFMVDDSIWTGTAKGRPFGLEGKGRPLSFRLLHVLEFTETGDIKRENVWLDIGAIQQQLA